MGRKGLGRGLSALLGEAKEAIIMHKSKNAEKPVASKEKEKDYIIQEIFTHHLVPGKFQPRQNFDDASLKDLSTSIKANGIIQPILVRQIAPEKYEIIAGERRWRASQLASFTHVPVIVRSLNDQEALETALIENIQRQDLSLIEEAEGYERLINEFNHTQEHIAKQVGKSRSHIANMLRILTLPGEIKSMVNNGTLSMGHARTLIGIDNNIDIANEIIEKGLNVRKTEKMIRAINRHKTATNSSSTNDEDLQSIESSLVNSLGMKVKIETSNNGGVVSINYHNLEQLDLIIQKLSS